MPAKPQYRASAVSLRRPYRQPARQFVKRFVPVVSRTKPTRTVAPVTVQSAYSLFAPELPAKPLNAEPPRTSHFENTALTVFPAKSASDADVPETEQRVKKFVPTAPAARH